MCTLLVAVLAIAIASVSVEADPQLPKIFVDPPTYTATTLGEVFTININVSNVQNLTGFEFKLGYNTTLLDAMDVVEGPFPKPPTGRLTEINEAEGYVWILVTSNPTSGNGTLAKITFKTTYAESASCTLHLYDTVLADPENPITHEAEDGNYRFATLSITVTTDKLVYLPGENIEIQGNVTLDGSPQQGLVALEVDDPANSRMVVRTLQIGPTPPPGDITIAEVYPCNALGVPKESFHRGTEVAYFNVSLINSGTITRNVTVTVNAYDNGTVPFGATSAEFQLQGQGWSWFTISVLLPEWTSLGNATVYANAFTDYPRNGGTPYCPEKSAKFQIINSTLGAAALGAQGSGSNPTAGNYSLTFKLSSTAAITGIYRVYATTFYRKSIINSTVFGVNAICVPDHYPTIQGAVNAATPTNNSIIVAPRTYNERVTINKTVTLVGKNPTNTIIDGSGTGTVVTVTADNVEISRFTIHNGGSLPDSGIALNNSSQSTISENIILQNYHGLHLDHLSQGNIIRGNTITSNNGYGINIHSSDNNDIIDNTLSNNDYGIYLNHSTSATLRNNNMICNKYNFGVFGDSTSDFTHDIGTSNTVDGKPIIYWITKHDDQIPSNAGYVAIVSSTKIRVTGLNLTKNGQGVLFAFTTDSILERVNTISNEYGIYLVDSYNNTIIGGTVSNNTLGIHQRNSNENIICHNNFVNNTNQTELYQSLNNTWNDGADRGNYWSDYMGEDLDSPPDGVGDTLLPHQGVDWYPLTDPWTWVCDVAVTSVTLTFPYNVSQIYPGWMIEVTVAVRNEGDFTRSFSVSTYYNGNTIETGTVPELIPLKETTINSIWNTADVSPGTYTIKAKAILPGDTNPTNDEMVDGTVEVRPLGDVNGDGKVNVMDKLRIDLALSPGTPYYENWPWADVNGDGKVNIMDKLRMDLILSPGTPYYHGD